MSVQAITCALALRGVSASEKLLLLALANYADEHMRCWPSQSRLADDTCLTERTVRSLLSALEARKIVSRVERRRADGSRSSDVITLHFAGEVTAQAEIISGGGEMVSGGVGKPLPGGGEMVSGLTTFEPSPNLHLNAAPRRKPEILLPAGYPDAAAKAQAVERAREAGKLIDPEREAVRFRDHAEQTDRRCRSWSAAWRMWIGLALERAPADRNAPQLLSEKAMARAVSRFHETGEWHEAWGPKPERTAA